MRVVVVVVVVVVVFVDYFEIMTLKVDLRSRSTQGRLNLFAIFPFSPTHNFLRGGIHLN